MPIAMGRAELQRLVAAGAQLVEVLPKDEYDDEHLPGAIHLPLKSLTRAVAEAALDRRRRIVVYCWDALCDMSPRAASRLERFGYAKVYDYADGKADWLAAGLPTAGDLQHPPRVVEAMDSTVPTCTIGERVRDVVARLDGTGSALCVVVNDHRVVQGRLRPDRLDPGDDRPAEDIMDLGPATVRADAPLAETIERLRKRRVPSVIVTTPEGVLLGVVLAEPSPTRPAPR